MSAELFEISNINPNNAVGGGGCACSEDQVSDCDPPYAIFYANEMESSLSPHCVVCLKCMERAIQRAEVESLDVGENDVIDVTYVELEHGDLEVSDETIDERHDFTPDV